MVEYARSLAIDSLFLGFLWIKTILTTSFLVNYNPTKANLGVTKRKIHK